MNTLLLHTVTVFSKTQIIISRFELDYLTIGLDNKLL